MSAIPSNLYTSEKVNGLKSIKTTSILLRPVNASATAEFAYSGNSSITFNIPAYANSFISPKSTFLNYTLKAKCSVATPEYKFKMHAGAPIFNRVQIRSGNGLIISDIQDYNILQKLLSNVDPHWESKKALIGDYRESPLSKDMDDLNDDGSTTTAGVAIQHDILASIMDQEAYLPVGLFASSGGHALEITLYLTKPEECMSCEKTTLVSYAGAYDYRVSNVALQIELIQLPEAITSKINSQLNSGNKVSIPMTNYRAHRSYFPAKSTSLDVVVSEMCQDLESVMVVITKDQGPSKPQSETYGDEEVSRFLGGSTFPVESYQFNYSDRYFPAQRVELTTKDKKLGLMHAIKNLNLVGKDVIITRPDQWKSNFFIAQSFKTSKEDDFNNGLNTMSSSAPLILQLKVETADANFAHRVIVFTKQNQTLNIFKGGNTTLTSGAPSE